LLGLVPRPRPGGRRALYRVPFSAGVLARVQDAAVAILDLELPDEEVAKEGEE
jgi:hypothetical protein